MVPLFMSNMHSYLTRKIRLAKTKFEQFHGKGAPVSESSAVNWLPRMWTAYDSQPEPIIML